MQQLPTSPGPGSAIPTPDHRSSSFFIGGPHSPSNGNDESRPRQRVLTVGGQSDHQLDYLQNKPAQLRIALLPGRLAFYVMSTCVFLGAFTGVATMGVVIYRVNEDIGIKDSKAEELVELYNTISGFVIALVEVLLGLYMQNFLAVFLVYLHNSFWYLHGTGAASATSNRIRSFLMFMFPVMLMLLIGNSLRSFQASLSTVGFLPIMQKEDLRASQPIIEKIKLYAKTNETASLQARGMDVPPTQALGPLYIGVKKTITPFRFLPNSNCSAGLETKVGSLKLNPHDFDSTNVVYGFQPQEWNSEALDVQLTPVANYTFKYSELKNRTAPMDVPTDIDMNLMFDLFVHGKVILDRGVEETKLQKYACADYASMKDPSRAPNVGSAEERQCRQSYDTIVNAGICKNTDRYRRPENLTYLIAQGLSSTIQGFRIATTNVFIKKFQLSEHITMETLEVSGSMKIPEENDADTDFSFFEEEEGLYDFAKHASSFCGSSDCLFIDMANSFRVPRGVVMMSAQTDCSYAANMVTYRGELGTYFPANCTAEPNSLVAVGLSTYIAADEYGSKNPSSGTPYVRNPRRFIRLSVAKISWTSSDLAENFGWECKRDGAKGGCNGLSFRLRSGRYVFVGDEAIPTASLEAASLENPIPLLQLNEPMVYVNEWGIEVTPERLIRYDQAVIPKVMFKDGALQGTQCSLLVDSYIKFINTNSLYFDRSFVSVYRSAFFYLFSGGSVTRINETAALLSLNVSDPQLFPEYNTLKGDIQIRTIRATVPISSLKATIAGCAFLLLLGVIVVVFPTRRFEFFPPNTSTAQQYIHMMNGDKYAESVHVKTLHFPESDESLPMEDFVVEEMTLAHRIFPEQEIPLVKSTN